MNKAEKLIQNFDFIRSKFKTHKDAHSGIEIVSPYMCIEEFESILTDFAEMEAIKLKEEIRRLKEENEDLINKLFVP